MTRTKKSEARPSGDAISVRIGKVYMQLSKSHRKTADYVLGNVFRAATMTIDELADAVGISVATANRFARTLGFDGYPQFRAELVQGFESTLAPVEKLRSEVQRPASSTEIIAATLDEDIANLEATRRAIVPGLCEQAVKMILAAERIYIIGFSASSYLAGLMAHGLEPYCRTVQSTAGQAGASHAARQLFKLGRRDLVIAIAFPRYVHDTIALAHSAREKGVGMIAITDAPSSPLAALADVTLYAQTRRQLSANSDAAALSLIEALCGAVAHQAKDAVHAASAMTEFVLPWLYQEQTFQQRKAQPYDSKNERKAMRKQADAKPAKKDKKK